VSNFARSRTVYIYLSLLVAVVGVILYYAASNPKTQEVSRLSFAVGLLAFLMRTTERMLEVP
jgi:hypothetical protein